MSKRSRRVLGASYTPVYPAACSCSAWRSPHQTLPYMLDKIANEVANAQSKTHCQSIAPGCIASGSSLRDFAQGMCRLLCNTTVSERAAGSVQSLLHHLTVRGNLKLGQAQCLLSLGSFQCVKRRQAPDSLSLLHVGTKCLPSEAQWGSICSIPRHQAVKLYPLTCFSTMWVQAKHVTNYQTCLHRSG